MRSKLQKYRPIKSISRLYQSTIDRTKAMTRPRNYQPPSNGMRPRTRRAKAINRRFSNASQRGRDNNVFENEKIGFKHGKSMKVSPAFLNKVKIASSNLNSSIFKAVANITQTKGLGIYFGSTMTYDNGSIYAIFNNIGGGGAGTNATTKYTIESLTQSTLLTNNDNAAVNVRVYECVARYDIPSVAAQDTPLESLTLGFTAAAYTNGATDSGSTAFQSPAFTSRYKILNVKMVKFQPGETKTFTLSEQSPVLINIARWISGPTGAATNLIAGLGRKSMFLMFQAWGEVALDSAALTHVGLTGVNMSLHATTRYNYRWTQDSTNTNSSYTGVLIDGSSQAPYVIGGNPTFIETLTGAVVAETPA